MKRNRLQPKLQPILGLTMSVFNDLKNGSMGLSPVQMLSPLTELGAQSAMGLGNLAVRRGNVPRLDLTESTRP
jgi:hypothetical protein